MNSARVHAAARRLGARPCTDGPADAELLGRFLDARDEGAFAELVARHGPAVLAACRAVLRDPNDADDAAQATFLVLVRRAGAVRDRAAVGAWLCRVAWRTANRLRADNARRAARASAVEPDSTPAAEVRSDALARAAVLDEVARLPDVYRVAVLACYAAGASTAEAARQLGWPKGTLLTRLAWARKRLCDRLGRRGVTLAGGLAAAVVTRVSPNAAARLAGRVAPAAVALSAGEPLGPELVSERVLPLTNGVVRAMTGTKLKSLIGLGFLAAVLLGLGLGRTTVGTAEANPGDGKKPTATAPAKAEPAEKAAPAKPDGEPKADAPPAGEVIPAGPGKELVVRRPLGSYTREVQPYGRATLTFTEDRLHVRATVTVEKFTITVDADADYTINRESLVYGVITGADVSAPGGGEAAVAFAPLAAVATDLPFAFRVRVEDDAIAIKDIKAGPFGSPLLMEAFGGKEGGRETAMMAAVVCGKFKADANPDRNAAPPAARPKKK